MGSLGHEILDQYFKKLMEEPDLDGKAFVNNILMNLMIAGDTDQEIINILQRCFAAFFNMNPFEGGQVLGIEKEFVLPISPTLYYPFVVDFIYRRKDGCIIVVDHKFTANFYKPWDLDLLPQIPKYLAAIRELGLPADGGEYSVFRTGFSKKSAEDEDVYKLQPAVISDKRIETTHREQITAAQEIQQRKALPLIDQDLLAVRTANKMVCNSCSFKSICVSDLNGHDRGLLMRSEYRQKEERVFTVESGEEADEES